MSGTLCTLCTPLSYFKVEYIFIPLIDAITSFKPPAPLIIFNYSFSQDYNAQQKKLEAQKLSIKKEIEKINVLVSENKKMTITLLDNIEDVELKISVRNKLIEVNNQQSKNLSNQIKNKNDRIYDLQIELKKLKDEYATIVSNSYKKRSSKINSVFLKINKIIGIKNEKINKYPLDIFSKRNIKNVTNK